MIFNAFLACFIYFLPAIFFISGFFYMEYKHYKRKKQTKIQKTIKKRDWYEIYGIK